MYAKFEYHGTTEEKTLALRGIALGASYVLLEAGRAPTSDKCGMEGDGAIRASLMLTQYKLEPSV